MKTYTVQRHVGKARHVVSFHDGVKTHKDGSPFFDVAIFANIPARNAFIKTLKTDGYRSK